MSQSLYKHCLIAEWLLTPPPVPEIGKARTGKQLTEAEKALAKQQAAEGWTRTKIAKFHGVGRSQVMEVCKGIKRIET